MLSYSKLLEPPLGSWKLVFRLCSWGIMRFLRKITKHGGCYIVPTLKGYVSRTKRNYEFSVSVFLKVNKILRKLSVFWGCFARQRGDYFPFHFFKKFAFSRVKRCVFVNLALKIQCQIVKYTLLQTSFLAILPTGKEG